MGGRFAFLWRLSPRLLAFNLLLVFLPVAGLLLVGTFERLMLEAQERAMVQHGRVVAAALAGNEPTQEPARALLAGLERRTDARLRVVDRTGTLLADTAQHGPRRQAVGDPGAEPGKRESWLYRIAALPFLLLRELEPPKPPSDVAEHYEGATTLLGSEVQAALEGRYGAATRISPGGQRSVTLYCAIPIREGEDVVGAVLVSQSTFRILQSLYAVRLSIFTVFLGSLAVASVLSLLVSTTIARPLRRLRDEAEALLDRRGRLAGRFRGLARRDEVGDLSRSLAELSRRLAERIRFAESFAADVSHSFRNPLAAIRAAAELALESDETEEQRRLLVNVQGEVARLEGLLSGVREITRIDARLDEEPRAPVGLASLLDELTRAWQERAGRGVTVALRRPAGEVWVEGSVDRLAQAFEAVIDNAVSFTPEGSDVEIELSAVDSRACVAVRDRGPGIPPEHLGRVFDRFFSHRPDDPSAGEHSGLGLAIARSIVEGHGGTIHAANRTGGGAEIAFQFPLSAASRPRGETESL